MLLEGLQLPLTTPFYPDGRLNLRKLEQNVAAYSLTPAAGLAVLSANGEPSLLSDEETRQVLQTGISAAAAEKVMLAGIARDSVTETLALADYAASLAYDAALIPAPSLLDGPANAERSRELLTYFQVVADRSALPVVLCSRTGPLPMEVVVELAAHPRILGLVDGDAARIATLKQATAAIRREVTVTSIFAAVTGRMLARQQASSVLSADTLSGGMAAGCGRRNHRAEDADEDGRLPDAGGQHGDDAGCAASRGGGRDACVGCRALRRPRYEVLAAWKDGDRGLAEEKQQRLLAAAKYLERDWVRAAIKFGCDLNGYFGGAPRLPLLAARWRRSHRNRVAACRDFVN